MTAVTMTMKELEVRKRNGILTTVIQYKQYIKSSIGLVNMS
jgi:hypothetical protein